MLFATDEIMEKFAVIVIQSRQTNQRGNPLRVENKITPFDEQIKGFFEPGADGPIYMLNLLKFKDKAEYADGRETDLTGAQAFALYVSER